MDTTFIAPPPNVLPKYGSTTNAQAQQAGKNDLSRGGRGVGEDKGVAALGFTCSRSGMIARTLCRRADPVLIGNWSGALAESSFY